MTAILVEDLCTNYSDEYDGGYELDSTFIEYVKPLVDDLNATSRVRTICSPAPGR